MKRTAGLLAAAGMLLAACSSTGSSGGSASPSPTLGPPLYVDPSFGYTLTYAAPFTAGKGADLLGGSVNNPPAGQVMFYDSSVKVTHAESKQEPKGDTIYPVSLTVSVFPLQEEVTPANWEQAKTQLQHHTLTQFKQQGVPVGPLQETTIADRPALTTEVAPSQAVPLRSQLYFVFDGSNEYELTTQSPKQVWDKAQPTFDKMLRSFTLPGTWPSGSPSPSSSASPSSS